MNSIPRSPGIYKIVCAANEKIYIGSAVNLYQRWNRHRSELRTNKHPNLHLQNAWNKYGESVFAFEVLELSTSLSLLEREDCWIGILNPCDPSVGFNVALKAGAPMKGRKASLETREKLRNVHLGKPKSPESIARRVASTKGRKFTPQHIENMRKSRLGKKPTAETRAKLSAARQARGMSPEAIKKSGETRRKLYVVINPDGIEALIKGLTPFCRSENLNASAMIQIAKGERAQHKGWKCRYA